MSILRMRLRGQLELQLSRIGTSPDIPTRFPDWDLVTSYSLQPGQCVQFQGVDTSRRRSSCSGIDTLSVTVPQWFVGAYQFLFQRTCLLRSRFSSAAHRREASSPKTMPPQRPCKRGHHRAAVRLMRGPRDLSVPRHLRRHRSRASADKGNIAGLNRLARGDLTHRLPAFRLAELNRISEVFNALSEELSIATSERTEFARRLVDTQEQERRHIARELHDEIAQKLERAQRACGVSSGTAPSAMLRGSSTRPESWRRWLSGLMMIVAPDAHLSAAAGNR